MEVASPLTITHASAGTKRSLVCSPGLMDSTSRGPFSSSTSNCMDMSDDNNNMQRAFKRRRFMPDTTMEANDAPAGFPSFMNMSISNNKSIFSGSGNGPSMKRCRQDALSPVQSQADNLERVVETQSSEIEYLKTAKANLESSLDNLKSEHDKTLNENRILKRAVTIQQERQTQASGELEAARQYKVEAEENIRRLQQMILSLRYHLQSSAPTGNDFMGFPPQPPDVY